MTLNTEVYILDPVDPHEVFRFCQQQLADRDDLCRPVEQQVWSDKQRETWDGETWAVRPGNSWRVANQLGQDLPAILEVEYQVDGPLRSAAQAMHTRDCDEGCDGAWHRPCCIEVSFDAAYGTRDKQGRGCGDIHAELVSALGLWLDERGVRWEWRNEFTGDVHGGEDRYPRLVELLSGGFEASAWFRSTVLPAIQAAHDPTP